MKSLSAAVLVFAIAPLVACSTRDLGTGANTVERDYARPASEVCKAALACAAGGDFKVLKDTYDPLGGDLLLSRADGREIRIGVKSLTEKTSRAGIRVEPGDRDLANLLHERIAAQLGIGIATSGWLLGGDSVEGTYDTDLAWCTAAARRTIAALAETSKNEDSHPTWFQIDGRLKDSTPVRIRLDQMGDRKTRARFIAGVAKSDDHKATAQKMKSTFEANLKPAETGR